MSDFSHYRGESAVVMKQQTCSSIAFVNFVSCMPWYYDYMRVLVIDEIGVSDAQVPASAPRRNSTCLPTVGDHTTNNIGE